MCNTDMQIAILNLEIAKLPFQKKILERSKRLLSLERRMREALVQADCKLEHARLERDAAACSLDIANAQLRVTEIEEEIKSMEQAMVQEMNDEVVRILGSSSLGAMLFGLRRDGDVNPEFIRRRMDEPVEAWLGV